ncbi:hypothetical protein Goshw_004533, partial [Gossypium schwendimanii]|nr:hypothetical protein [Gossypium schwendimanii]
DQWDNETKQLFYYNYGDLSYLLSIKVDKYLFRALAQFWNPAYSCFTFGKVDLIPTVEDKGVTLVLTILAETFRSLNACQRAGEGRFIGCAQLLLAWFHSHF